MQISMGAQLGSEGLRQTHALVSPTPMAPVLMCLPLTPATPAAAILATQGLEEPAKVGGR
jgi:hypothetical protein